MRSTPAGPERVELGVQSLADVVAGVPPARRVADIVELGVHADRVGIDVFGVGEHHTSRFAVSSPAVVLAAVAARTSSITLTSAVSVLSVLDPIRLYQDFAQLDQVSGGRAEITVGRSAYAEPFTLFGVDRNRYDEIFAGRLDLLLALRADDAGERLGRLRPELRDSTIVPRLDRLLPVRVGVGGSPDSARRAGALGLPMTLAHLIGGPGSAARLVRAYRQAWQDAGHPGAADVGLASHLYVGATSQGAREDFYPYYRTYFREGRGVHLDRAAFDEMAGPEGALLVGSPAEIGDKMLRQREALGAVRFVGQVDLGGIPQVPLLRSVERLADEVAPVVHPRLSPTSSLL
ncbi:LLM class flavin-dependent oxidoreductase [Pseudonocardia ailaonensis]|uniref:LLM class flavin-dependent oxidoreductase n=1 Tax=Pseudonocardia ailaonensis TaxID=367279 RepID=A0ABN2N2B2_9PSEU